MTRAIKTVLQADYAATIFRLSCGSVKKGLNPDWIEDRSQSDHAAGYKRPLLGLSPIALQYLKDTKN